MRTGRAEKYRAETEAWLHRHGIQFESLTMTTWATKGERMEAMRSIGGRGAWKAGHAERLGVGMFIESCPKQAGHHAARGGIPVLWHGPQGVVQGRGVWGKEG